MNIAESKTENALHTVTVNLKNESSSVALLNKVHVKDAETGERILPVFFDDNYISLLPGESRCITLSIAEEQLLGQKAAVHIGAWNAQPCIALL